MKKGYYLFLYYYNQINLSAIGKAILLLFLTMEIIVSCRTSDKENGFLLEEFIVDEVELKSIVDSVIKKHLTILQSEEKVMSLNITHKDSITFFVFSLRNKNEIIDKYIYRENKRILGYINSMNEEILLLSDIDELPEVGLICNHFVHPTGNVQLFEYLKYPSNLYIGEDHNSWPYFELIYDPTYIIFPYKNNRFTQPYMTTNPDSLPLRILR